MSDPQATSRVEDPVHSRPSVATLVRRRALDLIVIAWVAVVGLTTGRQLVDWWREDPAITPLASGDAGEDWSRRPIDLRVGTRGMPMHRAPFVGSRDAVEQQLLQRVQARLQHAAEPTSPIEETERQLLERLATEQPIATDHGRGVLYRWPAPWPGVIGTIHVAQQQRLAVHGFAVPAGEQKWTIFLFDGTGESAATQAENLPPGALPLLSWTDASGRRVATFRGPGPIAEWVGYWDQQYRHLTCTVREVQTDRATLQFRDDTTVTDLHLHAEKPGQLTGVMWTMLLSPPDALQSLPTDPLLPAERSPKDSP